MLIAWLGSNQGVAKGVSLVAVGLIQQRSQLDMFERLAVPEPQLAKALARLQDSSHLGEVVILATCLRTEVYAVAERFHDGVDDIHRFFSDLSGLPEQAFMDFMDHYVDDAVAQHLFEVAAGLDSSVLGESEILGQVRRAWEKAVDESSAGPVLGALFRHAVEAGKKVRTQTALAQGITSLAQAGVALAASERGGDLDGLEVLVVGAGEVADGVVQAMSRRNARIVVANRTLSRAAGLAGRVGGRSVTLESLDAELAQADVVLVSVGGGRMLLDAERTLGALRQRPEKPLTIIDLGVPRNVDPRVGELDGVVLSDMDSLRSFVEAGVDGRRREVQRARSIISEELERYRVAMLARGAAPVVSALRARAEQLRMQELSKSRARMCELDDAQWEQVELLTKAVIAKILHEPTVRLKQAAGSPRGERLLEAVRHLFDL